MRPEGGCRGFSALGATALAAFLSASCARPPSGPPPSDIPSGPEAQALGVTSYRVTQLASRPTGYALVGDGGMLGEVVVAQTPGELRATLHLSSEPEPLGLSLTGNQLRLTLGERDVAVLDPTPDGGWTAPREAIPAGVERLLPTLASVLADDAVQGNFPLLEPSGQSTYRSCQENCAHTAWCGEQVSRFDEPRCPLTCWRCLACVRATSP